MGAIRSVMLLAALGLLLGCNGGSTSFPAPPGSADRPTAGHSDDPSNQVWREVSVEKGRFKVSMPGQPVTTTQTVRGASGPIISVIHKARKGPIEFDFSFVTYTDAAIKAQGGPATFIETLATTMMIQRRGSEQDSLEHLEDAGCPAIEQKYHFPPGPTASGGLTAPGYGRQRLFLIGKQLCWLRVEVLGSCEENRESEAADIQRFFDSLAMAGGKGTSK